MYDFTSILILFFYIYVVLTVIFLLLDNRDTSTTFAWVFVFVIFPVFGQVLYFLIGRNWRKPSKKQRRILKHVTDKLEHILQPLVQAQSDNVRYLERIKGSVNKQKVLKLLFNNSDSILTVHNQLQIIQSGAEKFDLLRQDILAAQKSIHMEYFIWRSDVLTREFKDILIQKSQQGVRVRILYDALGSFFLSKKYIKEMREAGVEIYPYYDFLSVFTFHTLNYRNHRKIVVIDGRIGYTGGMNMGEEYQTGGKRFSSWRDTHLRMEGEAVSVLQAVFLTSWLNTTDEDLIKAEQFDLSARPENKTSIQITTSGPDSKWESIRQLYFALISSAEKSIKIQSPYFIPDDTINTALKTAALSGLDVKIMMTGVPDKKLPFWSAYTFFESLLSAGVKIYHYEKGFLHAKTISIDDELCSVGTANMDLRSFHLNYEISTLIYDTARTRELADAFEQDLLGCREITLDAYRTSSNILKFRNSLARLFAPLL